MSKKRTEHKTLTEFARDYAEFNTAMEIKLAKRLAKMKDKTLERLEVLCRCRTQANCWWAEYRIARKVQQAARDEMHYRKRKREAKEAGNVE